eukprot:TRINITY_DN1851_c1_g1_i1.p2 TRINITY_DN1851_c1_g1~~TRINITY_DN1851_c1_g1_i1.p2  ORF type:complete len:173 (+),score=59.32 TRINITY_DN1851_c1_g1_i1:68-520(+)
MLVKALRWPIQSVLAAGALAFSPLFSIVPYVQRKGTFRNANPRECQQSPEAVAELPPWVLRARNAHNNNLEMLGFYAAGIVVAITAGVSPAVIAARATEYVGGRAVYNVVYVAGEAKIKTRGYLRTAVFFLGCLAPAARLWLSAAAEATL